MAKASKSVTQMGGSIDRSGYTGTKAPNKNRGAAAKPDQMNQSATAPAEDGPQMGAVPLFTDWASI